MNCAPRQDPVTPMLFLLGSCYPTQNIMCELTVELKEHNSCKQGFEMFEGKVEFRFTSVCNLMLCSGSGA
jgi:hypothetical protein